MAWGRITLAALAWQRGALRTLAAHKAAVVAFALVEFAIPFSAISMGERWNPSSVTAILIATVALLDERLGVGGLIGFALVLLGSWLATRGSRSAAEVSPSSRASSRASC